MAHLPVKAQKIVDTAAVLLEQSLVVPAVFRREGIDAFKGAEDDTINVKVPGVLPFRTYGWRNDRTTSLQFDEYKERKVPVTFGGDIYSAIRLTDEQADFDLDGWTALADVQTKAIGSGLEWEAAQYLKDAPYAVTLGVATNALKTGLIRARGVQRKLRTPDGVKTILCGAGWEEALLNDDKLNLASNVGDAEAVSSLREATLGRRYGYNFVVAPELDDDVAIALVDSAFIFATGAPTVPSSAPFGATASYNDVALTWIRDYETEKRRDRSVFNTYKGFRYVDDPLIGVDEVTGQAFVSEHNHFVRAIKLVLDGTDSLPGGVAGAGRAGFTAAKDDELFAITGLGVDTI